MDKVHEIKKQLNQKDINEKLSFIVEHLIKEKIEQDTLNTAFQKISVGLAILSLILAFGVLDLNRKQVDINSQIAETNEKISEITDEYYKNQMHYNQPNIILTEGYITKLYVFKNDTSGCSITIVGIASVYNYGEADDLGLVKIKKEMTSNKTDTYNIDIKIHSNGTIFPSLSIAHQFKAYYESNPFSIPVEAGTIKEIPILITYKTEDDILLNESFVIPFNSEDSILEVIDPINKTIINEIKGLPDSRVEYTMGEEKATVKILDRSYIVDVRYTENIDEYHNWKNIFLLQYGRVTATVH